MKEIPKRYNPEEYEQKWADHWVENKVFASTPDDRDLYSIVIPPPNVTGVLHMGHALNNVLQDIIIRVYKTFGRNTMWMPGTDHGGIATQNVVERMLLEEGKTRHSLGREKFLERMWKWKEESGGTIINQLKRLGCGCDWDRLRFTMDEQCSMAVKEAFIRLYNKGLIYRGEYLINWCPRCSTALAEIEVEHSDRQGKLWYLKYPVKDSNEFAVVATTRPETMLGDTAVAVNPKDERYKNIIGKKLILPVVGREIEVIADEFVDPDFGTGMVKVTPAHDPNDFEMGQRHNLEFVRVINEEGKMTNKAGEFEGQDRIECRKNLVNKLKEEGYLEKIVDYTHAVGECYRCSTIIEPLLSKQWFLKMKDFAESAIKASRDNKVSFMPERWEKPYLNWLENLHDWCISRQIWWGHRIPVYYCKSNAECPPIASADKPDKCPTCGSDDIIQDEDVLDTWFSSALWPFSTLGWPEDNKDLDYYYPTNVLVTGHEILYLWVARMVMMGLEMKQDIPFENVNIHGIIRDEKGLKMSKSKGNVIDPIEIIKVYGTDALRFALAKSAIPGRDIQLSDDDFIGARNFCNKLWNATRLILSNINIKKLEELDINNLELADKWILYETDRFAREIKRGYEEFNNGHTARLIYELTWKYFCDWYLELAKIRLYAEGSGKSNAETVLITVLIRILNLIHPIMPFISSQLWEYLKEEVKLPVENILEYNGYQTREYNIEENEIAEMNKIMEIISGIRNIRGENSIQPSVKLNAKIKASVENEKLIKEYIDYIRVLGGVDSIVVGPELVRDPADAVSVLDNISLFVSLPEELKEKEINRIEKRINEVKGLVELANRKLRNRDFIEKAPEAVVGVARKKADEYAQELIKLEKNLMGIKEQG
jgi:valyl-tRNA synthetase